MTTNATSIRITYGMAISHIDGTPRIVDGLLVCRFEEAVLL